MMKFKLIAIAGVLVSLVALGTGCSKNDEKLAYLKEKEKLLEQQLAQQQSPSTINQAPMVANQAPVVVSAAPTPVTPQ